MDISLEKSRDFEKLSWIEASKVISTVKAFSKFEIK